MSYHMAGVTAMCMLIVNGIITTIIIINITSIATTTTVGQAHSGFWTSVPQGLTLRRSS